ncbi:alpha/beta fold hydrolase [Bosea sp. (in: a-proteobacteria)]|uniref:alpha/beta fold hydrolase n=1 Tax=Bosea sp. (in: a-proteobacteria) TaxID=1871050 RepID=UPI003429F456|nr:alpha/beta fold hydrolase [Bosea sp. (in: a-proteobacteria)]
MSARPTIVLVHGFWGGAAHWTKVIIELARMGHADLRAVEMPLTSLADDAERTRKMVKQQAGQVLLVGHSYGGAVITEAGDLPNVVGLVYIAAFAPDAGKAPAGSASRCHRRRSPTSLPTATAISGSTTSGSMRASARTLAPTRLSLCPSRRRRRWRRPSAIRSPRRPGR